jgi:hypothetical protein
VLFGDRSGEPGCNLVDGGQLTSLGTLPLRAPPLHLTFDVPVTPRQVAQTDLVDIDRVQVGQHVDEVLAGRPAQRRRQQLGFVRSVEHHPVHERHHVERGTVHVRVLAERKRAGHRHSGSADRRDDAVLAGHIVGRGQHVAERRPPHHDLTAGGIGHPEREVGAATGDEREVERRAQPVHVRDEPCRHPFDVDAAHQAATVVARGPAGVNPGG